MHCHDSEQCHISFDNKDQSTFLDKGKGLETFSLDKRNRSTVEQPHLSTVHERIKQRSTTSLSAKFVADPPGGLNQNPTACG